MELECLLNWWSAGKHVLAYLPAGLPNDAVTSIRSEFGMEAWLLSDTRLVHAQHDDFILGVEGYDFADLNTAARAFGNATRADIQ